VHRAVGVRSPSFAVDLAGDGCRYAVERRHDDFGPPEIYEWIEGMEFVTAESTIGQGMIVSKALPRGSEEQA